MAAVISPILEFESSAFATEPDKDLRYAEVTGFLKRSGRATSMREDDP